MVKISKSAHGLMSILAGGVLYAAINAPVWYGNHRYEQAVNAIAPATYIIAVPEKDQDAYQKSRTSVDDLVAGFPDTLPTAAEVRKHDFGGAKYVLVHIYFDMTSDLDVSTASLLDHLVAQYHFKKVYVQGLSPTSAAKIANTTSRLAKLLAQQKSNEATIPSLSEYLADDVDIARLNTLRDKIKDSKQKARDARDNEEVRAGLQEVTGINPGEPNYATSAQNLQKSIKTLSGLEHELNILETVLKSDIVRRGKMSTQIGLELRQILSADGDLLRSRAYQGKIELVAGEAQDQAPDAGYSIGEVPTQDTDIKVVREYLKLNLYDREDSILERIAASQDSGVNIVLFDQRWKWRNNILHWNREHPDERFSLVEVVPESYQLEH